MMLRLGGSESGMAGLGLDDLVQRDLSRDRGRVTAIAVSAISAMLVMGLTPEAVSAQRRPLKEIVEVSVFYTSGLAISNGFYQALTYNLSSPLISCTY